KSRRSSYIQPSVIASGILGRYTHLCLSASLEGGYHVPISLTQQPLVVDLIVLYAPKYLLKAVFKLHNAISPYNRRVEIKASPAFHLDACPEHFLNFGFSLGLYLGLEKDSGIFEFGYHWGEGREG